MKKILSLLLTLVIIFAFAVSSYTASAESEVHKITVHSAQNIFPDTSAYYKAGKDITIAINLKTQNQILDGQFNLKSDASQVLLYDYLDEPTLPDAIINPKDDGNFIVVFGSGTKLLDTTKGGVFFTYVGKTDNGFNSDQVITIDFKTLRGGRYTTNSKGRQVVDAEFSDLYIADSKVEGSGFSASITMGRAESVTPEPSTAKPTDSTAKPTSTTEKQTGTTAPPSKKLLYGDSDLNDAISVKDATLIQKHAAQLETLKGDALTVSDVDGSGTVNVKDATCVQKYLAKLDGYGKVNEAFN